MNDLLAVFKTFVQFKTTVDTVFMNSLTVTFRNVSSAPLDKGGGVSLEFSFLDRDRLENFNKFQIKLPVKSWKWPV